MGIFQADAVIKESISLGIEDLRNNAWLLDYMMEDFTQNPYLKDKYGQGQIASAREWFLNNRIEIYMGYRTDRMQLPCVSITLGSAPEKSDMKHMADASTETVTLMPNQIGKPIPYIVKPFTPTGYDDSTGEVGIDPETPGSDRISAGMILVNPANGNGYEILDATGDTIIIQSGIALEATQLAVVPQFQYYKARVEHTFVQGNFNIICTAHGDPQNAIWLHDIVLYSLYRYRETLLEALGMTESLISSGDLHINQDYSTPGGETAWDRPINITGQIENSFVKAPKRFIEYAALKEKVGDGFKGGIKIISNLDTPSFEDTEKVAWYTTSDSENSEE